MAIDTSIYSHVRPVATTFDLLARQQALGQGEQQTQLNRQALDLGAQRLQQGKMQLQQEQDTRDAQQKIAAIMAGAVSPDGKVDEPKLRAGFAAQGLGHLLPQVEEQIAKARTATEKLKETVDKNDADEQERWAATGAFLEVGKWNPEQAQQIIQKLAGAGKLDRATAQGYLAQIQQSPTPETVQGIFTPYVSTSKKQTDIKAEAARTADANAQTAERTAKVAKDKGAQALAEASVRLFSAAKADKAGKQYAAAWQELPEDVRGKFDAPDAFNAATTPDRALDAARTPDQIARGKETAARDAATQAHQKALEDNARRAQQATSAYREWRKTHTDAQDPSYKRDLDEWKTTTSRLLEHSKEQISAWTKRHPFGVTGGDDAADPQPEVPDVPSFDEWRSQKKEAATGGGDAEGAVQMRTPDGRVMLFPKGKVAEAKARGAKVVE